MPPARLALASRTFSPRVMGRTAAARDGGECRLEPRTSSIAHEDRDRAVGGRLVAVPNGVDRMGVVVAEAVDNLARLLCLRRGGGRVERHRAVGQAGVVEDHGVREKVVLRCSTGERKGRSNRRREHNDEGRCG